MLIGIWKLALVTLAITELAKTGVKKKKILPWLAIAIAIAVSLLWVWKNGGNTTGALWRGLGIGIITTGLYKAVKAYIKSILSKGSAT